MLGKGFGTEDGAAKAVLLSLGLETHGLTLGFCFPDFQRAVLICAQLARWWYAQKKKRPESMGQGEACPWLGPGETQLPKLLSAVGEPEGVVWIMKIDIVVFGKNIYLRCTSGSEALIYGVCTGVFSFPCA